MSPKELLEINDSNGKDSQLLITAQKLHKIFTAGKIPYAIIGGLAVVRSGAARTTDDIDILIDETDWKNIKASLEKQGFETADDHAVNNDNNITIDILFSGSDWDMPFSLYQPQDVIEYDPDLKANFIDLYHLLELKTAVYLQKKKEYGIEIAAKDLGDVVELIKVNSDQITVEKTGVFHKQVKKEFLRICRKVLKKR